MDGATAPHDTLVVRNLRVTFPSTGGGIQAVRGVSFDVQPGRVLAIVGESGSGKSVTARSLVGLAGSRAAVSADELRLGDMDLRSLDDRRWRHLRGRRIGFVLQDALVSLDPLRTVGREIAEPLKTHRLVARPGIAERVRSLLVSVGVPEPELRAAQRPHELSGGLRQRALIASAIAADPSIIVADEPTTALDVTVQAQILRLLDDLAKAGRGVVLITHDLAVVSEIADHVIVLRAGEVVEEGSTAAVLHDPQHDHTRALLAAVPSAATRGSRLSGRAGGQVASWSPGVDGPRTDGAGVRGDDPVLELRDVSVRFRGPDRRWRTAVDRVSFTLSRGETLGIVGESGSGKTTVGRVALALQAPASGEVLLDGRRWDRLDEGERRPFRRRIQTISQDPLSSFDPRYTVERIIRQPFAAAGTNTAARRADVEQLLGMVGLDTSLLARRPASLSGGQRQRVAIAQALASSPEIIVCDEPVSALDVSTQAQVLDLLLDLQSQLGVSLIFISHDLGVVQHLSHRILVMKDGRIVEEGDAAEVFGNPHDPYTRRLLEAVPRIEVPGAAYGPA